MITTAQDQAREMSPTPPKNIFQRGADKGDIEQGSTFQPLFDDKGLIPVIATDDGTGDVVMFAWMNAVALAQTIETGVAHFWSRSKKRLWKKGEESGNVLRLVELRADCDQDVLWMKVVVGGKGAACHTGRQSCFYRTVEINQPISQPHPLSDTGTPRAFDPADIYKTGHTD